MNSLEKLLYLTGVSAEYLDYNGQLHQVPVWQRERVLEKQGINGTDAAAIERAVFELDALPWRSWLRPCTIISRGQPVTVHCHPDELDQPLQWTLDEETGRQISGEIIPGQLPEVGEYALDQARYTARAFSPGELTPGYHRLTFCRGEREEQAQLIVAPETCHHLEENQRIWGISCHLYTLVSERNWGIGDFSDLYELVERTAPAGADLIGLSPLHAPCSDSRDTPSPYGPSDRRFLSPLYLDPCEIQEFSESNAAKSWFNSDQVQGDLQALRKVPLVDYDGVATLKYRAFELLYEQFSGERNAQRCNQFQAFVEAGGEALESFASFEVAHNIYAEKYRKQPEFFQYLQWQCALQLDACQARCQELGMQVGLVGDLPVGSVPQGCEVQSHPELFMSQVTIGAPPDPLGPLGQDWGMPAINPVALKKNHFAHFIALLQANMAHVGALRIDHAMALMRLWWCLHGEVGEQRIGVYVYYPFAELMALLRLESLRNQCIVIGEDLGVVPKEFRAAMAESAIYGNHLLYFEQALDGHYLPPGSQQKDVLLMTTNHDVPTLADWWQGSDLRRRCELGLVDQPDLENQAMLRDKDKQQMLRWLSDAGYLSDTLSLDDELLQFDENLCLAIHEACASSASQLLLLQLEDLQLMTEPLNIPGTYREYPNWRRKQQCSVNQIFNNKFTQRLVESVNRERKK